MLLLNEWVKGEVLMDIHFKNMHELYISDVSTKFQVAKSTRLYSANTRQKA